MQAHDRTFREIIGNNNQFIVPVFQRDYKWSQEQWQRLWSDVNRPEPGSPYAGHFLGSFVQIDTGRTTSSLGSWLVIDGQQRLATLTLLVAALRDHINATGWDAEEEDLTADLLDDLFLKNRHGRGDAKYKLSLRRTDDATLHTLVDGKDLATLEGNPSGQVADAYKFFRDRLRDCDPAAIYNSVASLRIVEVTLERGLDDPQFVFESLNDTGVDLSEGDKVRNYLLMRLEEQQQNDLYTEYWSKIEGHFRNADGKLDDGLMSTFLQNYIALKRKDREQAQRNHIYDEFKKYHDKIRAKVSIEPLLADMKRFAGYYAAVVGRNPMASKDLNDAMRSASQLSTASAVLIMRLYDCYDKQQTLTEGDFAQALGLIESYLLRHQICGHRIRNFWRIFADMNLEIDDKSPGESLRRTLVKSRGSYGFWSFQPDSSFFNSLQTTKLAQFQICKHILERLENFESKEPSSTSELSIEHIMPQNPGVDWQTMLSTDGEDWEQVHSDWLHRLGNLTLTGYNPEMSNRPFEEKKAIPGGFDQSAVRLNQFVREQPAWTAAEMETRSKQLAERALKIWPYPESSEP